MTDRKYGMNVVPRTVYPRAAVVHTAVPVARVRARTPFTLSEAFLDGLPSLAVTCVSDRISQGHSGSAAILLRSLIDVRGGRR